MQESPIEDRYDSYINYANRIREIFGLNYALSMFCCAAVRNYRRSYGAEDRPELIAGMRVILLRGERRFTRKTAEDQHLRIGRDDRRQAALPYQRCRTGTRTRSVLLSGCRHHQASGQR